MSREGDRVTVFQDEVGEWRWNRKAENGEIIADSAEGYVDKGHAMQMAHELNPGIDLHLAEEAP